jgi:uncharacterized protein (UPF0335 family)
MTKKTTTTAAPAEPKIGHNSTGALDKDRLRSLVERIEELESQKVELSADIKDVYQEAKGAGFDVAALRQIIKLRKQDQTQRQEREALIAEYMTALGDYGTTPLGAATIARASGG